MFKAIENGKIVGINETGKFPLMNYDSLEEDTIHKLSDYVHCNDGQFVLTTSDLAIKQYKEKIRSVRNRYLGETDKFLLADYPITSTQKAKYKQYRVYLRDYPDSSEDWFEHEPMSFDEWSTSQTTA